MRWLTGTGYMRYSSARPSTTMVRGRSDISPRAWTDRPGPLPRRWACRVWNPARLATSKPTAPAPPWEIRSRSLPSPRHFARARTGPGSARWARSRPTSVMPTRLLVWQDSSGRSWRSGSASFPRPRTSRNQIQPSSSSRRRSPSRLPVASGSSPSPDEPVSARLGLGAPMLSWCSRRRQRSRQRPPPGVDSRSSPSPDVPKRYGRQPGPTSPLSSRRSPSRTRQRSRTRRGRWPWEGGGSPSVGPFWPRIPGKPWKRW